MDGIPGTSSGRVPGCAEPLAFASSFGWPVCRSPVVWSSDRAQARSNCRSSASLPAHSFVAGQARKAAFMSSKVHPARFRAAPRPMPLRIAIRPASWRHGAVPRRVACCAWWRYPAGPGCWRMYRWLQRSRWRYRASRRRRDRPLRSASADPPGGRREDRQEPRAGPPRLPQNIGG